MVADVQRPCLLCFLECPRARLALNLQQHISNLRSNVTQRHESYWLGTDKLDTVKSKVGALVQHAIQPVAKRATQHLVRLAVVGEARLYVQQQANQYKS